MLLILNYVNVIFACIWCSLDTFHMILDVVNVLYSCIKCSTLKQHVIYLMSCWSVKYETKKSNVCIYYKFMSHYLTLNECVLILHLVFPFSTERAITEYSPVVPDWNMCPLQTKRDLNSFKVLSVCVGALTNCDPLVPGGCDFLVPQTQIAKPTSAPGINDSSHIEKCLPLAGSHSTGWTKSTVTETITQSENPP